MVFLKNTKGREKYLMYSVYDAQMGACIKAYLKCGTPFYRAKQAKEQKAAD